MGVTVLRVAIVFSFAYFGWMYGERLGRGRSGLGRFFIGLLSLLALQSIWQTAFYYLGLPLGTASDIGSLVLAILTLAPLILTTHVKEQEAPEHPDWKWIAVCIIPALAAAAYILRAASLASTVAAIRTPWPLLPAPTIACFGMIAVSALLAAWKSRTTIVPVLIAAVGIAVTLAIAPLVYSNGFGFDGFLHRASMEVLDTTGTLNPKPPYYIGWYVFETWFSRLTNIALTDLDRWIMPIFSLLIPLGIGWALRDRSRRGWAVAAVLLLLPLAPFVASTPQALAYLTGFAALCAALGELHPVAALTLGIWSLAIHPLAGLPLFFVTLAIVLKEKKILAILAVILAGLSVPAAFILLGHISASGFTLDLSKLVDKSVFDSIWSHLQPPSNRVALWADGAALLEFLQLPLAFILAAALAYKNRTHRREWLILLASGALICLAGLILKTAGDFAFLIDYERGNYADRLFLIGRLILLVPAAAALGASLARTLRLPVLASIFSIVMFGAAVSANAYNALPRQDAANNSHGWSVGHTDIEAVRWIDKDSSGSPYTVLANQSVSAGAIQEFGFKRYVGDTFYYPIPTGGPLYQDFLDAMSPDTNLDPMRNAAKLGQSKLVYVVLNDYWWDAARVAEHLSSMSDTMHDFNDGQVRVYRFEIN